MIFLILCILALAGVLYLFIKLNKITTKFLNGIDGVITNEDYYHAGRIGIGINTYKQFSKIYEDLQNYILENGNIPEVTDLPKVVLKKFGAWKAFCNYKSKEETPEDIINKKKWLARYKVFKVVQPIILCALIGVVIFIIFYIFNH